VSVFAHTCQHIDVFLDSSTFRKYKAVGKIIRRKFVVSNNKVLSVNFVKKKKKKKKKLKEGRKKERKEKVPKTRRLEVCSPRDVLPLLVPMAGCHSSCRKLFTGVLTAVLFKIEVFGVLRNCRLLQSDDGYNMLFRNVGDISPVVES